ncbi:MAG: DNA alkylation repair protein, partial [Planctomycetota bacterium]
AKTSKKTSVPIEPGAQARCAEVLAWVERNSRRAWREGMTRFGIEADKAVGMSVAKLRAKAKEYRRDHALALELWKSAVPEARMLATFVDDPREVTPAQMERWCRDFDNWGLCDAACYGLFDRTPHVFTKAEAWAQRVAEFEKRAAFALLAGAAQHRKDLPDEPFFAALAWIEAAAIDERNFVKKGVSWALRGLGQRGPALRAEVVKLAQRLADSKSLSARWIGKDALRDLNSATALRRLARQSDKPPTRKA